MINFNEEISIEELKEGLIDIVDTIDEFFDKNMIKRFSRYTEKRKNIIKTLELQNPAQFN